jgi:hypothetical protein
VVTVTEEVEFAGVAVDPAARLLLVPGRAQIALGVDQARVLELLIDGRGGLVGVQQIEGESVNPVEITVSSLNLLLSTLKALTSIAGDRRTGYRLLDLAAEGDLSFGDLRLNRVTRLLVVEGRTSTVLSPQSTAVLGLLMEAGGGTVGPAEMKLVVARSASGTAVGNLSRRMSATGTKVTIVNERASGWRLIAG